MGFLDSIDKKARDLSRWLKSAKKANSSSPDAAAVLAGLRGMAHAVESLSTMTSRIEQAIRYWEREEQRLYMNYETLFREAADKRGWKVDGQWPALFVDRGIAVEFDINKQSVSVGGVRVPSAGLPAILLMLEPLVHSLIPPRFVADEFLRALARAYDHACGGTGQAAIYEVYRSLVVGSQPERFWRDARGAKFTGLGVDQFRARLSLALERRSSPTAGGREIRLLPPLSPQDGIFMYLASERRFGYVGRIEFLRHEATKGPEL
jgi:hypothetical protein